MTNRFSLFAVLALATAPVYAQSRTSIQILNKTENQIQENGQPKTVVETTPSNHVVKNTGVQMWQTGFMGYLFTDPVAPEELLHLTARIGNRVFPSVSGVTFEDGRFALGVAPLDLDSLSLLRGESFDVPLQKQLRLEWNPTIGHQVSFKIYNTGTTPLTLSFGTTGTDDKPARDPELALTATREGKAVAASTKPMPLGDWSTPEVLASGKSWECLINLDDYLNMSDAGHYNVRAHYTLRLQNPVTNRNPKSWNLGFDGSFGVDTVGTDAPTIAPAPTTGAGTDGGAPTPPAPTG